MEKWYVNYPLNEHSEDISKGPHQNRDPRREVTMFAIRINNTKFRALVSILKTLCVSIQKTIVSIAIIAIKRRNGRLLSYKGKATFAIVTCDNMSETSTAGDKIAILIFQIKYAHSL